jgi:Ca2+-binding EF-hand superfamily protein
MVPFMLVLLWQISSAAVASLFESIDADADGRVTAKEVVKYLELAHDRFETAKHNKVREKNKEFIDKRFVAMDADSNGFISVSEAQTVDKSEYLFSLADDDRNQNLNKDEAAVFIIPELATDTKRLAFFLTESNFDRMDKDKDELLDYAEYAEEFRKREMKDTSHYDATFMDMEDEEHKSLVEQDIHDTFHYRADKDQDGKLHKEELVHAYLFFMERPDFAGEAEAAMESMDENTDGHVVFSELEATPKHVITFLSAHMDLEHEKHEHYKDHALGGDREL